MNYHSVETLSNIMGNIKGKNCSGFWLAGQLQEIKSTPCTLYCNEKMHKNVLNMPVLKVKL